MIFEKLNDKNALGTEIKIYKTKIILGSICHGDAKTQ